MIETIRYPHMWRKSLESGRKFSENHQKHRNQYVYIIKRTLHVSSKIWILCSRGKNNISLVHCTHSWDIVLATRNIKFISSCHCVISSMYFTLAIQHFFEGHDYLITGHNLECFVYIHMNICDLLLGFQLQRKILREL